MDLGVFMAVWMNRFAIFIFLFSRTEEQWLREERKNCERTKEEMKFRKLMASFISEIITDDDCIGLNFLIQSQFIVLFCSILLC